MDTRKILCTVIFLIAVTHTSADDGNDNNDSDVSKNFPYVVLLYQNSQLRCEGVLVSYSHVITFASCVHDDSKRIIPVGNLSIKISDTTIYNMGIERKVEKINLHPSFTVSGVDDIAVVHLSTAYSKNIATTIKLADTMFSPNSKTDCVAIGLSPSNVSRKRKIISESQCLQRHQTLNSTYKMLPSTICANPIQKDQCMNKTTVLICDGTLTGFLYENSDSCSDMPEIYTNISKYADWIQPLINSYPKFNSRVQIIGLVTISQMAFAAIIS